MGRKGPGKKPFPRLLPCLLYTSYEKIEKSFQKAWEKVQAYYEEQGMSDLLQSDPGSMAQEDETAVSYTHLERMSRRVNHHPPTVVILVLR